MMALDVAAFSPVAFGIDKLRFFGQYDLSGFGWVVFELLDERTLWQLLSGNLNRVLMILRSI